MHEAMIEANGLSKRYGEAYALRDVSFRVNKGEVLGFLGPNGAGKTTTMKLLTCFMAPSSGSARVNGCEIGSDSLGARAAIGYLPESTPLYTEMLVNDYLEFAGQMRGLKGHPLVKAMRRVIEQASLGDVLGKSIGQLSKGYRQRVGLAQALIHEPPILILDEPMSGLDPNQAVEIRDVIRDIGKERTVILSTHNLAEVQVTCGRVLIIAKGRLVADDTPDTLQARAGQVLLELEVLSEGTSVAALKSLLDALPGIRQVQVSADPEAGLLRAVLTPAAGRDGADHAARAAVFRAVSAAGVTLVGLRQLQGSLEQVFRELTLSGPQGDSAHHTHALTDPGNAQALDSVHAETALSDTTPSDATSADAASSGVGAGPAASEPAQKVSSAPVDDPQNR